MKIIQLRPNGESKVDDDDYEWLQHFIWRKNPVTGYAFRSVGVTASKSVILYQHRFIRLKMSDDLKAAWAKYHEE